ncbi:hypothetical protein [Labrenzia sp. DG1229]|uniref:hypothetical protein n=1 Tax=Labrenzia sp. DG1229 TaxID=681847 RepID=UPI00048F7B8C|nr:hypothetical protein [Labrenzia sp. DG1229]
MIRRRKIALLYLLTALYLVQETNSVESSDDFEDLSKSIEESIFTFGSAKYTVKINQCLLKIIQNNSTCSHPEAVSRVEQSIFLDEIKRVELYGSNGASKSISFFKHSQISNSKTQYLKCNGVQVVSYDELELSLLMKGDLEPTILTKIDEIRKDCAK